jgi:hypothetical protein
VPLDQKVTFPAIFEKGNRVQVPKVIMWQFKMEQTQLLKVGVSIKGTLDFQYFYARMDKQGRLHIPKLTLIIMAKEEKPNIAGQILEVKLEPA